MRKKCYFIACAAIILLILFMMNLTIFLVYRGYISPELTPVKVYVLGVLLFAVLFFAYNIYLLFLNDVSDNNEANDKELYKIILIVCFFFFFLICLDLLFRSQFKEAEYVFEIGNFCMLPRGIWIIAFICLCILVGILIYRRQDISIYGRWCAYAWSCIMTVFTNLVLNPFNANTAESGYFGDVLRSTYVTETIYNVLDGIPFSYDTTGLYGHYGLFFLLPLKISGNRNSFYVIAAIFVLIALAQQLALIYIVDLYVKKNWIAALLAIGGMIRWSSYVPTVFPLRSFFIMTFFFFYVYLYKKELSIFSLKVRLISILLMCSSFLWNVEIGLVCIGGYVIYTLFEIIFDVKEGKKLREIVILFFSCMFSIMLALIIMNIYNVICGAQIGFRVFFYPIYGKGDSTNNIVRFVNSTYGHPRLGNFSWEYATLFFMGTICYAWYTKKNHDAKWGKSFSQLITAVASMGLMALVYYMNESLWNCMMLIKQLIFGLFGILLFVIFDDATAGINESFIKIKNRSITNIFKLGLVLSILIFVCFNAMQMINDPIKVAIHKDNNFFNTQLLHEQVSEIENSISEDTFGVGQGATILYHMMDRNNHMKMRDTSAWEISSDSTYEKGILEILEHDSFVIPMTTDSKTGFAWNYDAPILDEVLKRDNSYKYIEKYQVGDVIYMLYSRTQ